MGQTDINTPQLSYPFEILDTGTVREVEQDDIDEISMSVEIILRYPLNYREELPDFGMPDLTFVESTEQLSDVIQAHVARWEDRVRILVEEDPGRWNEMVRSFTLRMEGTS